MKEKRYIPYILSQEILEKIKNELLAKNKLMIAIYLMLSYDSAGRRHEVLQVKKTDKLTAEVISKNEWAVKLRWTETTQKLIDLFLSTRQDNLNELFIVYDRPATQMDIINWCHRIGEILSEIEGREGNFNHHIIRQSKISNTLEGKTDEEIKQMLYEIYKQHGLNYGGFWV